VQKSSPEVQGARERFCAFAASMGVIVVPLIEVPVRLED